jgi:type I restriction enzyme, S subunit
MVDWEKTRLREVVELHYGKSLPKSKRINGPFPVIGSGGIIGYHNDWLVDAPGLVVGRKGNIGTAIWSESNFFPIDTTYFVTTEQNLKFIYYVFKTLRFVDSHAAVPGINRETVYQTEVLVPNIKYQNLITCTLSAFDNLIENNTRRIEILEETARALYREWFVHYRYPGHENDTLVDSELGPIPEGWEINNIFNIANVDFGFAFSSKYFSESGSHRVVRIRNIPKNFTNTWTDELVDERYLITNGDTLIGMDGEFHMGIWADDSAYLNQRVARVRTKGVISQNHLHLSLESPIHFFNKTLTGTTVAHLGKRHLAEINVVVPSQEILEETNSIFDTYLNLTQNLKLSNKILTKSRDLLLPRLISGELDVSDLDLGLVE